jgi:hypothetical protein
MYFNGTENGKQNFYHILKKFRVVILSLSKLKKVCVQQMTFRMSCKTSVWKF